jgi:hypothetical protein
MSYELGMGAVDRALYKLERWLTKKPPKRVVIAAETGKPAPKQRPK